MRELHYPADNPAYPSPQQDWCAVTLGLVHDLLSSGIGNPSNYDDITRKADEQTAARAVFLARLILTEGVPAVILKGALENCRDSIQRRLDS